MLHFKILILMLVSTLALTGCWDRRELNELGIVLALALDQDENSGDITLTSQVVRPSTLAKDGGGPSEAPVAIVTTTGKTIFEAIRNTSKEFDRRNYFTNIKVLVISENLAKRGVKPVLDMFIRAREIRPLLWLVIAKDTKARDIIGASDGVEKVQANYLNNIIKQRTQHSQASLNNLMDFSRLLLANGVEATTGVMQIKTRDTLPVEQKAKVSQEVKFEGAAVFKKDKLVGYLDETQTRGLNWARNEVKSGFITVPSPHEKGKYVSIEIKDASGKIIPQVKNGKISFIIEIQESGDIFEQQNSTDFTDQQQFAQVEKSQGQAIEREIKLALFKAQKEFQADIFGLGNSLSHEYPEVWQKIGRDWEKIFPTVKCSIKVNADLRTTVLLLKPLMPRE